MNNRKLKSNSKPKKSPDRNKTRMNDTNMSKNLTKKALRPQSAQKIKQTKSIQNELKRSESNLETKKVDFKQALNFIKTSHTSDNRQLLVLTNHKLLPILNSYQPHILQHIIVRKQQQAKTLSTSYQSQINMVKSLICYFIEWKTKIKSHLHQCESLICEQIPNTLTFPFKQLSQQLYNQINICLAITKQTKKCLQQFIEYQAVNYIDSRVKQHKQYGVGRNVPMAYQVNKDILRKHHLKITNVRRQFQQYQVIVGKVFALFQSFVAIVKAGLDQNAILSILKDTKSTKGNNITLQIQCLLLKYQQKHTKKIYQEKLQHTFYQLSNLLHKLPSSPQKTHQKPTASKIQTQFSTPTSTSLINIQLIQFKMMKILGLFIKEEVRKVKKSYQIVKLVGEYQEWLGRKDVEVRNIVGDWKDWSKHYFSLERMSIFFNQFIQTTQKYEKLLHDQQIILIQSQPTQLSISLTRLQKTHKSFLFTTFLTFTSLFLSQTINLLQSKCFLSFIKTSGQQYNQLKSILLRLGRIYHQFAEYKFGDATSEIGKGVVIVVGLEMEVKLMIKDFSSHGQARLNGEANQSLMQYFNSMLAIVQQYHTKKNQIINTLSTLISSLPQPILIPAQQSTHPDILTFISLIQLLKWSQQLINHQMFKSEESIGKYFDGLVGLGVDLLKHPKLGRDLNQMLGKVRQYQGVRGREIVMFFMNQDIGYKVNQPQQLSITTSHPKQIQKNRIIQSPTNPFLLCLPLIPTLLSKILKLSSQIGQTIDNQQQFSQVQQVYQMIQKKFNNQCWNVKNMERAKKFCYLAMARILKGYQNLLQIKNWSNSIHVRKIGSFISFISSNKNINLTTNSNYLQVINQYQLYFEQMLQKSKIIDQIIQIQNPKQTIQSNFKFLTLILQYIKACIKYLADKKQTQTTKLYQNIIQVIKKFLNQNSTHITIIPLQKPKKINQDLPTQQIIIIHKQKNRSLSSKPNIPYQPLKNIFINFSISKERIESLLEKKENILEQQDNILGDGIGRILCALSLQMNKGKITIDISRAIDQFNHQFGKFIISRAQKYKQTNQQYSIYNNPLINYFTQLINTHINIKTNCQNLFKCCPQAVKILYQQLDSVWIQYVEKYILQSKSIELYQKIYPLTQNDQESKLTISSFIRINEQINQRFTQTNSNNSLMIYNDSILTYNDILINQLIKAITLLRQMGLNGYQQSSYNIFSIDYTKQTSNLPKASKRLLMMLQKNSSLISPQQTLTKIISTLLNLTSNSILSTIILSKQMIKKYYQIDEVVKSQYVVYWQRVVKWGIVQEGFGRVDAFKGGVDLLNEYVDYVNFSKFNKTKNTDPNNFMLLKISQHLNFIQSYKQLITHCISLSPHHLLTNLFELLSIYQNLFTSTNISQSLYKLISTRQNIQSIVIIQIRYDLDGDFVQGFLVRLNGQNNEELRMDVLRNYVWKMRNQGQCNLEINMTNRFKHRLSQSIYIIKQQNITLKQQKTTLNNKPKLLNLTNKTNLSNHTKMLIQIKNPFITLRFIHKQNEQIKSNELKLKNNMLQIKFQQIYKQFQTTFNSQMKQKISSIKQSILQKSKFYQILSDLFSNKSTQKLTKLRLLKQNLLKQLQNNIRLTVKNQQNIISIQIQNLLTNKQFIIQCVNNIIIRIHKIIQSLYLLSKQQNNKQIHLESLLGDFNLNIIYLLKQLFVRQMEDKQIYLNKLKNNKEEGLIYSGSNSINNTYFNPNIELLQKLNDKKLFKHSIVSQTKICYNTFSILLIQISQNIITLISTNLSQIIIDQLLSNYIIPQIKNWILIKKQQIQTQKALKKQKQQQQKQQQKIRQRKIQEQRQRQELRKRQEIRKKQQQRQIQQQRLRQKKIYEQEQIQKQLKILTQQQQKILTQQQQKILRQQKQTQTQIQKRKRQQQQIQKQQNNNQQKPKLTLKQTQKTKSKFYPSNSSNQLQIQFNLSDQWKINDQRGTIDFFQHLKEEDKIRFVKTDDRIKNSIEQKSKITQIKQTNYNMYDIDNDQLQISVTLSQYLPQKLSHDKQIQTNIIQTSKISNYTKLGQSNRNSQKIFPQFNYKKDLEELIQDSRRDKLAKLKQFNK